MSHRLKGFEPYKGDMEMRQNGSLIAMETGTAYAYAINKLQDRGTFFVSPQDEIYAGQVVGESTRSEDIVINLTKSKKLTNMRASGRTTRCRSRRRSFSRSRKRSNISRRTSMSR